MADPLPVCDYQPSGRKAPTWRVVLRMIIFGFLCGTVALLVLGYLMGDVDDHGWLFFTIGLLGGTVFGYVIRSVHLPRRWAVSAAMAFYSIAILIVLIAVPCLITGTNIVTGATFEEMEALVPIIWLIGSVVPLTAGTLFLLLAAQSTTA